MSPKDATPLDSLPVGRLGIIPLKSCEKLGSRVDDYIVKWRRDREHQEQKNLEFEGYERDSYLAETFLNTMDMYGSDILVSHILSILN